ncbi:unnamed protein product [Thlaspi arvense]|uniref:Uncharacterized protein n=1 Tax=Thlaspi arvense TaxID=13288 RepID=A0AAU9SCE6_THLAR|nr:unnamed protein product [Thlaspi arvense]
MFVDGIVEGERSRLRGSTTRRAISTLNDSPCFSMAPAVLGALFSVGAIGVAYAESEQANENSSAPIDPPPNYVDIAKKERARIEEFSKRML